MTEFAEVVRSRRMTRAFDARPVEPAVLDDLVDLAARAPSAGKTQGWHLVVLSGHETAMFWDATLPAVRRDSFRWQRLLSAPVIALPLADADHGGYDFFAVCLVGTQIGGQFAVAQHDDAV